METQVTYRGFIVMAKVSKDVVFLTRATKNNVAVPTKKLCDLQHNLELLKLLRSTTPYNENDK